MSDWLLREARKDEQSLTADWEAGDARSSTGSPCGRPGAWPSGRVGHGAVP